MMIVEGDSTPPTEVTVGDNPSPLSNTETPLSPTVPGPNIQTPVAKLCPECMRGFYCGECDVSKTNDEPSEPEDDLRSEETDIRVRRNKPDSSLKDQQSTGRKRAAKLYPLDRSAACQWREASSENPKGGDKMPITFSCNGLQQARHHGPDYNTLNNDPTNVSLICHVHHNGYHALNNQYKDEQYIKLYGGGHE